VATASKPRKRTRGEIETLPSGSLRVRVYAGIDPVSKKKHYLTEVVPVGPKAAKEAEKVRTRLLNQVDEKRSPRMRATVNQLMDRYMEVLDVEPTTRHTYEGYIRNHIWPLLGDLAVGRLDGEVLDSFYAQLRTCRAHCRGRKYIEHRAQGEHECDARCWLHECRPLAASSIRQIHGILSGAAKRAVRWRWIGTNPIEQIRRKPPRVIELPASALTDPMALVTALSAARLAAGLPVAYWDHEQVDRQMIAADILLRSLDPADTADRVAAA
jgi:hypothetical protein